MRRLLIAFIVLVVVGIVGGTVWAVLMTRKDHWMRRTPVLVVELKGELEDLDVAAYCRTFQNAGVERIVFVPAPGLKVPQPPPPEPAEIEPAPVVYRITLEGRHGPNPHVPEASRRAHMTGPGYTEGRTAIVYVDELQTYMAKHRQAWVRAIGLADSQARPPAGPSASSTPAAFTPQPSSGETAVVTASATPRNATPFASGQPEGVSSQMPHGDSSATPVAPGPAAASASAVPSGVGGASGVPSPVSSSGASAAPSGVGGASGVPSPRSSSGASAAPPSPAPAEATPLSSAAGRTAAAWQSVWRHLVTNTAVHESWHAVTQSQSHNPADIDSVMYINAADNVLQLGTVWLPFTRGHLARLQEMFQQR